VRTLPDLNNAIKKANQVLAELESARRQVKK